ncbi:DoxX family protein OS=Tsukamurella paurometabola (strain ATCC 8368 / DSM / CCUG 35730 / CIP 100753 / JCM 10117 / KCTC 9821 / NBRC 16120 / NCIMB 702349/ NCTC 13040) OX=521096 GN=Tpau_0868 PE=4 SV=1 [Tsukamurella paurometabola]|uniref:DoxX family protein n=1 Tax=Tsukamurella paurometabola (strain ATCC 8368 / DSM 20162 / CCUG 35730 / CIP 100753 / JCM 10117 / KCTC 9821 / NBRC 16120 / NCIMB 702349 / NCTC 13040) TaxID=521096 RepID=D5UUD1_TSUPD|nr:hypothetical protein [Tsukamurella paurometabola]ADG77502.1 conserved hypothetical protein [Tsukamurella paurometabola DSM 20162]SUP27455.1 Uncharacterised protein [Tsukamurella paurometabola]
MSTPSAPVTPPADLLTDPADPPTEPSAPSDPAPWTSAQKAAFRLFFSIGGGLLILAVFGSLFLAPVIAPVQAVFARFWAAISGTDYARPQISGTGDTLAIWQYHLGWLVAGTLIPIIWSLLDRHRPDYRSLAGLLWQVGRLGLAIGMMFYGMAKVIPTQMGAMSIPAFALTPAGDVSRFNVLWGFMGASDGYSIITGLVELISGLLLLSRRTWAVGALGSIVSMGQVVLLDTFYNVPVKFLAFEFLLIAIAILTPYWPNIIRAVLGRAPGPAPTLWPAAGSGRTWLRRTGKTLAGAIVVLMLTLSTVMGTLSYSAIHTPRSTLDGTWHATSFQIDGRQATVGADEDGLPWANLAITLRGRGITESFGYNTLVTQDTAARVTPWFIEVDDAAIEIKRRKDDPAVRLDYRQPDADHLTLVGSVDGKRIAASFERRAMLRESEGMRFTHPEPDPQRPIETFP